MSERPKILAVDDRQENIVAIEALLEGVDATVISALSGNEALTLLLDHEFALVLMDVQMPEMDGFETASLMRGMKSTRHVPIIFVTAISKDEEHVFKGYDSGAIDYLYKPITAHILKSKVKIFLELYSQNKLLQLKQNELNDKIDELMIVKDELEHANQRLHTISLTDPLTSLANRRHFDDSLQSEWRRAIRDQQPVSLIVIDIDNFKVFNDTYGHLEGDNCLKKVSAILQSSLMRSSDLAARYGGEEFVVLLPGTDIKGAMHLAETIRKDVENLDILLADTSSATNITISLGVETVVPKAVDQATNFVAQADKALYKAKEMGKNCTYSFNRPQKS